MEDDQSEKERAVSATIDRFDGEYEFLSSFHSAPVRFEGMRFPTVEHAYQAAKTSSHEERIAIQACPTPGRAKRMGRRVSVRDDWNDVKIVVMDELLHAKFARPQMRDLLLATGGAVLIEGNHWHDQFWGVCTGCKHGCEGIGENQLGRLLMSLRRELRGDGG